MCLAAVLTRWEAAPPGGGRLWIGERILWKKIVHSEPVAVPSEVAQAGSEGVVVSSLLIDNGGKVRDVSVVQSPHPALVETLQSSFQKWRFSKTSVRGHPVEVTGKVILYLVNDDHVGRFLTPEEMLERRRARSLPLGVKNHARLVDVRNRREFEMDSTPQAENIPLDELQVRAPVELDLEMPVAIECSRLSQDRCQTAAAYLKGEGFNQVTMAGKGSGQCLDCQ